MPYEIVPSKDFEKELRKLGDKGVERQVLKAIQALIDDPKKGEELKYELKGLRSLHCAGSRRVIYEIIEEERIIYIHGEGKAHVPYAEFKRYLKSK